MITYYSPCIQYFKMPWTPIYVDLLLQLAGSLEFFKLSRLIFPVSFKGHKYCTVILTAGINQQVTYVLLSGLVNDPVFDCETLMIRGQTCSFLVEMTKRDVPGFAIGGLSGGEEKDDFWRMVTLSTDHLPREKPRYLMGVGYVCSYTVRFLMRTAVVLTAVVL